MRIKDILQHMQKLSSEKELNTLHAYVSPSTNGTLFKNRWVKDWTNMEIFSAQRAEALWQKATEMYTAK